MESEAIDEETSAKLLAELGTGPRRILVLVAQGGVAASPVLDAPKTVLAVVQAGASATEIAIPAGEFETIVALVPIPEPLEIALRRMREALEPGGRLIFSARGSQWASRLGEAGFRIRKPVDQPIGSKKGRWIAVTLDGVAVAERDELVVRGATERDLDSSIDLFERSFHHRCTAENWHWKYGRNPRGNWLHSLALDQEGRALANYGGYSVALYRSGLKRGDPALARTVQIGDIMSAPEARHLGRGTTSLLARCAQHFYSRFCAERVAFTYGVHTAKSRGFSNRFLRVRNYEPVPYRRRSLVSRPWSAPAPTIPSQLLFRRLLRSLALGSARQGPIRVDAPRTAGPELDDLFDRVRDDYGFLVVRDRAHLRWRYFERPDADYLFLRARRGGQTVGWSVFRARGETLVWGDALFDPRFPGAVTAVLHQALSLREQPYREIVAWFPDRPAWWHKVVENLGLDREPEPQDLELGAALFEDAEALERLRDSFYYTYGDTDLF